MAYVNFDIIREPWSVWKLNDGTILRIRFVLGKIWERKTEKQTEARMTQQLLVISEAPDALKGPAGRPATPEQLAANIVAANLAFEVVNNESSMYRLSHGAILEAKVLLESASRSSLFGPDGEPQYRVSVRADISMMRPEKAAP